MASHPAAHPEGARLASLGDDVNDAPSPELEDRVVAALRERGFLDTVDGSVHSISAEPVTRVSVPRGRTTGSRWRALAVAASLTIAFGLGIGVGRRSTEDRPRFDAAPAGSAKSMGDSGGLAGGVSVGIDAGPGRRPAKSGPEETFGVEDDEAFVAGFVATDDEGPRPGGAVGDRPFIDLGDPIAGWSARPGGATIVKGVQPSGEPRRIARP